MSERCILFADVAGSTRLYEKLGDAEAKHAVERCLKRVSMAVEAFGGRVVKTIGDAVLADLPDAERGIQAACQMQQRVQDLPPVAGMPLAIRVGFHYGPVLLDKGDVFGDAVNLAARMADLARAGQILATGSTVDGLSALTRQGTREIQLASIKGKSDPVRVCEVLWEKEAELTLLAAVPRQVAEARASLRLRHAGAELPLDAQIESLNLGRDKSCNVVTTDKMASRNHARIERRGDKFILVDQSTNGTWLGMAGEKEIQLRREEAILRGVGRICFGHPWTDGSEVLEFEVT